MSTMTEPGFIGATASAVTRTRRAASGDLGGRDDDVHAADIAVELVLLGRALVVGQLARVAAAAARVRDRALSLRNCAPSDSACSRVSERTS